MSDRTLERVALLHGILVSILALGMASSARPLSGAWLGGGAIGIAYLLFWGIGVALLEGRRALALLLAATKVAGYLALVGILLTRKIEVDAGGFALGVVSFVAAALLALAWKEAETRLSSEGAR